jgi:hypothetical protein
MGFPMYPIGGAAIPAVDTVPPPVLPYYSSQTPSSSSSSPSPYPIYAMPIAQGPPPTTAAPSMGYPVYPMYAGVYATAPYMQSINGTAIPYGYVLLLSQHKYFASVSLPSNLCVIGNLVGKFSY